MHRSISQIIVYLFLLYSIIFINTNSFAQTIKVKLGSYGNLFSDVDQKDATAALSVLVNNLAKRINEKGSKLYNFEQHIYSSVDKIDMDLTIGKIDCISVPIYEYFELSKRHRLEPILVGNSDINPYSQFYIVAGKHANATDLNGLKGKKIIRPKLRYNFILEMWLTNIFTEKFNYRWENHFSDIKESENESKAILSVFFKKADACIISKTAYETFAELNPQLLANTEILIASDELIPGIFAIVEQMDEETKNLFKTTASTLHLDNEGRQILDLFKINEIHLITNENLVATHSIYKSYKKVVEN